ncbi:MAG: ribonucleotide reductase subunit alpha [Pseudomonadales bacterium]|nr:hypothetical protein [Pseudomonadales bacterium]MCP5215550.1 ribonucleotide reductase subunit alpha [Pseudomonadales bacterium]
MIATLTDLITAAQEQTEPQRLLFLFAKAEAQNKKKKSKRQHSGTISPVMCVDKLPEEITSFKALVAEADNITNEWDFMLVAGLSGAKGNAPSTEDAEPHLNKMANDLMSGQDLSQYIIFDRTENPIVVQAR